MFRAMAAPDPMMVELTRTLGRDSRELVQALTTTSYATVIVATVICQGLNARYYYRRVPLLQTYLRDTPPWVVDLQRSTAIG
jgi:hypothetical protein